MYFIGVTTEKSSIMKIFPEWAAALGLKDTVLTGIDVAIHAPAETYREVVRFIKDDPLSLGALVTTHKIDLYQAAKDLFDFSDTYASMFNEISSISKREGKLRGHAKDPISCGSALEDFVPKNYWKDHKEAGVLIMGAGGSAISMCSYFFRPEFEGNFPSRVVITNRSKPRLDEIERINRELLNKWGIPCEYYLAPSPEQNDDALHTMNDGSLVINATGLGKDRPGSPLTDNARFPRNGIVWEINYRGDLRFMHQALEQQEERKLHVEDGWRYFIYGWTQVIAEVFDLEIPAETLVRLDTIAEKFTNRNNG